MDTIYPDDRVKQTRWVESNRKILAYLRSRNVGEDQVLGLSLKGAESRTSKKCLK
jgi:hypothetical protein